MELLTTQELSEWCRSKYGRISRMAEKIGQTPNGFSSKFLDLNYPVTFGDDDTAQFRDWMREIENAMTGNSLRHFPRRNKLNNWFDAVCTRAAAYLRMNGYSGRNAKIHCNPRQNYFDDIDDQQWAHYRRCMKEMERIERNHLLHHCNFKKWVKAKRGRLTRIANITGMKVTKIKYILTHYSLDNIRLIEVDWREMFRAVNDVKILEKAESTGDLTHAEFEIVEKKSRSLKRRYELWEWLHESNGRAPAIAELSGGFYTNFNRHPSKFSFDYTDKRWAVLCEARRKIEEYENKNIFLSVLFNMWFWGAPGRMRDIYRLIKLTERTVKKYRAISHKNHIRSLAVDWQLIIEGMQHAEKNEKNQVRKIDYRFLSEAYTASQKRKGK